MASNLDPKNPSICQKAQSLRAVSLGEGTGSWARSGAPPDRAPSPHSPAHPPVLRDLPPLEELAAAEHQQHQLRQPRVPEDHGGRGPHLLQPGRLHLPFGERPPPPRGCGTPPPEPFWGGGRQHEEKGGKQASGGWESLDEGAGAGFPEAGVAGAENCRRGVSVAGGGKPREGTG